jgi:UDP-N-acetylmuramate--alanine ligase
MKYFFIGDQGISMRGLKEYMQMLGNQVAGSDLKTTGHDARNITFDIDVVVRSSAVNPGSEGWKEVEAAEKLGIKVIKRSELLGQITKNKRLIAVSGMHGKTTVATMAGLLLVKAGFDPTVLIGERVKEFSGDVIRAGKSDWFVAEACEYDRSFLDFYPEILVLTNIEVEHLDTYPGGLPEIKEAFIEYINHVPNEGTIIACGDDANLAEVLKGLKTGAEIIYYGRNSEKYNKLEFELKVPGAHNRLNALAVVALADLLKIDREAVKETLENFTGAKRRFEFLGNFNGADIIDDYGHHPSEIAATIQALGEKYPKRKKVVLFWPHQYKRILPLLDDFGKSFADADEVLLKPIFLVPGRDEQLDISSENIAQKIDGGKAKVFNSDDDLIGHLKSILNRDSVLLTIGIPPVYKIAERLINEKGE